METFPFVYHRVQTENPESGMRVQLGGSYIFTTTPTDPDQRKFTLTFPTMKYFLDDSNVLDGNVNLGYNMYALIKFYQRHKLHNSFNYEHPVHGVVEVKFAKPLIEPEGLPNGYGAVKEFNVELIEVV